MHYCLGGGGGGGYMPVYWSSPVALKTSSMTTMATSNYARQSLFLSSQFHGIVLY